MTGPAPSPVRLPAGVRDFLPRAAARRRAIAERLLAELEAWGYRRIITPVFEVADVLERGLGADARATALRFVEPGSGEVVALRPDFTPQVARMAATRLADVGGPLRLCYEGAVHRHGDAGRGRLAPREILQAGVELIGAAGGAADVEVLGAAAAALATIGVDDVQLDVGHVAPARWLLGALPAAARDAAAAAMARKDRAGVARAVADQRGVAELGVALVGLWGPADEVLARAHALAWPAEVAAALRELAEVVGAARRLAPATRFTVDLGDVRGFDYYTGVRFAGYARGAGDAVLRGGRYDGLVGRYGAAAGAVGFAIDIEAIAAVQRAAGIDPPAPSTGVLVSGADAAAALAVAGALRAAGVRAAFDPGWTGPPADRLGYAAATGWTHVLSCAGILIDVATGTAQAVDGAAIVAAGGGDATALVAMLQPGRP